MKIPDSWKKHLVCVGIIVGLAGGSCCLCSACGGKQAANNRCGSYYYVLDPEVMEMSAQGTFCEMRWIKIPEKDVLRSHASYVAYKYHGNVHWTSVYHFVDRRDR